jgi:3-oxoadipate enol-lactonase/4-carboxymuconolactone decarboxylase
MIALGLARRRPDLVAGLILCCTAPRIDAAESANAGAAAIEEGGVGALCRNMRARTPADGYAAILAALGEVDLMDAARGLATPTLCLAGERDGATPPDRVRALSAMIPGARFAAIPGAGRLPCIETPDILAGRVVGFVEEIFAIREGAGDRRYARGLAVRRRTLGAAYVDAAQANTTPFDEDFQRFITEGAWGSVWARPNLTPRERSMITLALLAALGHEAELALHTRATRNTGATPDDIREALLHVAVYGGVPAANTAFRVVKQTLKAMEETS